ncbi:MAG: peptide deformylase [Candidatus Portnoybacteria bacterium]|nr:peptide deformylase [Candidatus Portnoybacteria bacterium]
MKEIIKEPNSLLHRKCEPVSNFEEAKLIADELLIVIKSVSKWWNRWLGFAANQIGYSKRIIALRKSKNEYEILVNPVLVEKRFPFPYLENCYSLRLKEKYLVKRYLWARVKYRDLEGKPNEIILKGPSAIYQEIDHLDGVLVSEAGLRIL